LLGEKLRGLRRQTPVWRKNAAGIALLGYPINHGDGIPGPVKAICLK
jgi:hypothetical protein